MENTSILFKALGEETRLRILALLTNGELCVCDLMAALDMPQSTISRHLAKLKSVGLVRGRRNGVWMYYNLAEPKDELTRAINCVIFGPLLDSDRARADAELLADHLLQKKNSNAQKCA
jgi:ArsR family transcriptional regulator